MKTKTILILLVFALTKNTFSQNKTVVNTATVFVFLSETCPICQSYTLPLKELYKKYKEKSIRFVGVFPNYYVTQKDMDEFKKTYTIPFDLILDSNGDLTKKFNATITPEVFVENELGQVVYSGRIDDSFYAIGKRRKVITSTELSDALAELSLGQAIKINKTQAVGCIINASN